MVIYATLAAAGWGERGLLGDPNAEEKSRRAALFNDAVENANETTQSYDTTPEWHSIFDSTIEFLVCGECQDIAGEFYQAIGGA